MNARDLLASHLAGVLKGETNDTFRRHDRDGLDRDAGFGPDFFLVVLIDPVDQRIRVIFAALKLDPGVAIFRIFANNHQVDIGIPAPHALIALAGSQTGI